MKDVLGPCNGPFTYDRNCVLQFDFNSEISFYLMFTYQSETGFVLIVITASFHIPGYPSASFLNRLIIEAYESSVTQTGHGPKPHMTSTALSASPPHQITVKGEALLASNRRQRGAPRLSYFKRISSSLRGTASVSALQLSHSPHHVAPLNCETAVLHP